MKTKFKIKRIDLSTGGRKIAVINEYDAADLDLYPMDRVRLSKGTKQAVAIIDTAEQFVRKGEIGLFEEVDKHFKGVKEVFLEPIAKPESISYIKAKMQGIPLKREQIEAIITDVMNESLSDIELTAFISATFMRGLSTEETVSLTKSIVSSGTTLNFNKRIVLDKHSIGGVPGNKTSMIIIPIVAAAELTIPKTSSRAITSPAGTADVMEVLAPVDLDEKKIVQTVSKCNGCLVWGGAVNLAAADDRLIRVRHPLSLDPHGMLLASILAKKKAVGATHVLIDIPIGKGAKIYSEKQAQTLAKDFTYMGSSLGMQVHCIITPGFDPIGAAIGPALEAREALRILDKQEVSEDLREKSLVMAGVLLELGEKAQYGKGRKMAEHILESGKALEKMKQIIKAQGGNPNIKPEDIKIGKHTYDVIATASGRIHYIDIHDISSIARTAGAPKDKGAGLYLYIEKGDKIKKGQKIFTIFAESERKLKAAKELVERLRPVELRKVILRKIGEEKPHIHPFIQ